MSNKVSGIYAIINKVNWHRYIGSSQSIKDRWKRHIARLEKNDHHSTHLQHAWNCYGRDSFEFVVLLECEVSELIANEQKYIDAYTPEYNISPVAGRTAGVIRSDEYKRKQSVSQSGKTMSEETRKRISDGMKGKKNSLGVKHTVSEETRAKISASLMGHSVLEETRAKLRNNTFKHTDEAKKKISAASKGNRYASRKQSPDEIARRSEKIKQYWIKRRESENGS